MFGFLDCSLQPHGLEWADLTMISSTWWYIHVKTHAIENKDMAVGQNMGTQNGLFW